MKQALLFLFTLQAYALSFPKEDLVIPKELQKYCSSVNSIHYNSVTNELSAHLSTPISLNNKKVHVISTTHIDQKYKIKMARRNSGSLLCLNSQILKSQRVVKLHLIQKEALNHIVKM